MRLVESAKRHSASPSNPIENASVNATKSKDSWRFASWKHHRCSFFIACLCFFCVFETAFAGSALAQSAKTTIKARLFKQDSVFIGPHELWVCPTSLRSSDLTTGITTVVSSDGSVVVFNDKKRCFFKTTVDKMGMDPTVSPFTPYRFALVNRKWNKLREIRFSGEKLALFESFADHSKQKFRESRRLASVDIERARYAETVDLKLSSSLLKSLEYLYIIPPPKGVPVRVIVTTLRRKTSYKVALDTKSIEQKWLPTSFFSVPKTYKEVFKRTEIGDYAKRDAVLQSVTDLLLEHK